MLKMLNQFLSTFYNVFILVCKQTRWNIFNYKICWIIIFQANCNGRDYIISMEIKIGNIFFFIFCLFVSASIEWNASCWMHQTTIFCKWVYLNGYICCQLCRNTRKGKKNAKQSKQIVHKIYLCDFQSGGFFWISSKQKWSIGSCDNSLRPKKMCFKRKVIKKVPVNFWGKKIKTVQKKYGYFFLPGNIK